mmetsp:Transcript_93573/g.166479  ORF Transcript_93573/g.166479 Transcript_93573/m.166479 type:complete len:584 (+) Transcript_93573:159-1910(+)
MLETERSENEGQGFLAGCRNLVQRQIRNVQQDLKDRSEGKAGRGLFDDVNKLKESKTKVFEQEERAKWGDTFFGRLAENKYFEATTMGVILLNAVSIGIDADYNARFVRPVSLYEGPAYFIVTELFFAVYFTAELIIRFLGFRRKTTCFTDSWTVFDTFLVAMMDIETFVLPFLNSSGLGGLSVLRLLRLLRVSRMAKLMRTFPELMLIVKGMGAAIRAVSWTFVLIMMALFVFAIIFTSVYHKGHKSEAESAGQIEELFGGMSESMFSLIIMGTLLDDATYCSDIIRASGNFYMLFAFIMFIILSGFMMQNMLLGILVAVVANTAEGEKTKEKNIIVRTAMLDIVRGLSGDDYGITREQFMSLALNQTWLNYLEELDIKERHMKSFAVLLYGDEAADDTQATTQMSADDIIATLFRLQPGTPLESGDLATAETAILNQRKRLRTRLDKLGSLVNMAGGDASTPCPSRPGTGMGISPPLGPMELLTLEGPEDKQKLLRKGNTKESDLSTSGGQNWGSFGGGKITMEILARLNRTDTGALIDEIRRRHGFDDLETTGVPLEWFDEEMKNEMDTGPVNPEKKALV